MSPQLLWLNVGQTTNIELTHSLKTIGSDNIYILAPGGVYQFNSLSGVLVLHCSIPATTSDQIPHAVDLDLDGNAELIYRECVYSSVPPCSLLWCASPNYPASISVGTAVVNIDSDPQGEVFMSGNGLASLFDSDGTPLWAQTFYTPNTDETGFPSAADFNGDGVPDFGIAYRNGFVVLNGVDGSILKTQLTVDASGFTSSSAFDFQNDGKFEFVICGDADCFVVSELFTLQVAVASITGNENAAIADIDMDGIADIVSVGDDIVVINADVPWASSDSYWNQHGFNGANYNSQYSPQVTSVSTIFRSTSRSFTFLFP